MPAIQMLQTARPTSPTTARRFVNRLHAITAFVLLLACVCPLASAQEDERHPQRGFHPGNSYALSDIESISMANGNLTLHVPLGALPAGRGGSTGFRLGLTYNSKLYDSHVEEVQQNLTIENLTHLNESDEGGWRYDLPVGYEMRLVSRLDEEPGPR
ncbi:MAG: hypothetical protein ACRD9R_03160 [Pyrinomonadaceae bacterium]